MKAPHDPATNASRELILARVRDALAGTASTATASTAPTAPSVPSVPSAPSVPSVPSSRAYRMQGTLEPAARIELLCDRIGDYRAQVRRVGAAELAGAIAGAFAAEGATRVCVPSGIPQNWRAEGLDFVEDAPLSFDELDRVDGVLTGCTVAIAETGTIVLSAGPAEGRRALTLVPDLHVCVVAEEQVVETVPEAMAPLAELVRAERRPITLISGPSATSDIELSRVEGVHGPRRLVVLVVHKELP